MSQPVRLSFFTIIWIKVHLVFIRRGTLYRSSMWETVIPHSLLLLHLPFLLLCLIFYHHQFFLFPLLHTVLLFLLLLLLLSVFLLACLFRPQALRVIKAFIHIVTTAPIASERTVRDFMSQSCRTSLPTVVATVVGVIAVIYGCVVVATCRELFFFNCGKLWLLLSIWSCVVIDATGTTALIEVRCDCDCVSYLLTTDDCRRRRTRGFDYTPW